MTKALVTMQFKAGLVSQLLHTGNMDSNPALSTGVCMYYTVLSCDGRGFTSFERYLMCEVFITTELILTWRG
jgi:hypothetical protein